MKLIHFFSLVVFTAIASGQQFSDSGWFLSSRPEEETPAETVPATGELLPAPSPEGGSLQDGPEIAEAITPELQELARGLENDPKRIFDYVHDHIRYVHYFGSKKGAQLTLLERSGNDFDQCALLVALLRAAGHSPSYQFGTMMMPYQSYSNWVGTTAPWPLPGRDVSFQLNNTRGFPFYTFYTTNVVFHRVWVYLGWNGTNHWLDPAFKTHALISGINLGTATGVNSNEMINAAGGTSTVEYVQNLDETALRNKLRDYTTNLSAYLQGNYPNASVDEVLSGRRIVSSINSPLDQALAFLVYTGTVRDWINIPTNFMASLKVTLDGTNRFLLMPELQGSKLGLTFSTTGLGQLWLNDTNTLLLQKQTSGGNSVPVALAIDHPYGSWNTTNNTLVNSDFNDHVATNYYQGTNATYVLTYAFDPHPSWLRQRQERLDQYRAQGLADTSQEVLTETLNVMGLNWMLQTKLIPEIIAAQQNLLLLQHHRFGRVAQEIGKGYYVDIFQQADGIFPANVTQFSTEGAARMDRVFELSAYLESAAEHALIEQMQSSNLVAASTIKMLQVANANGQKIFLARQSNWTANVRSQVTNYNLASLDYFLNLGSSNVGNTVLLPQNGSNYLAGAGTWKGYGLIRRQKGFSMSMAIAGGYNGAYPGLPNSTVDPATIFRINVAQPDYYIPPSALGADPVSMVDGSFLEGKTDISIGGGKAPTGLEFARYYSSARRHYDRIGIGHGWTHNYDLRAEDVSAPLPGLGTTTPAQMAPIIVASRAALDLYDLNGSPKNWAVVALIAKWGVDQLINNAVSVTLGNDTIQFIKQPDGTFTPPAGSTMTLGKSGSSYNLSERHGNVFKFSSAGLLTNIVDQYNQPLAVNYNSSNWVAQVKDWKNRTLTFNYTGTPQRLTSITDSTGRTVSYGYTQGDLSAVTDPENETSTFLYDTNHQIIATIDALNQVVTSNRYDSFGRVIEQYSQGDTNQTWQLYWSGPVNTEEDPTGSRKRYFYDDSYRVVKFQDANGNYTASVYDGQDHAIVGVSPMAETNRFEFDGRHNVVRTIDALNLTNTFVYNSQDHVIHSTDARGNTSSFGFNSEHRLIGSTNAAGDWTTFTYNSDGSMATRVDAGGTTTYAYDGWGQLNGVTYPASLGSESYSNDSRGDRLSQTNPRGFVTSFQYDLRRQLTNSVMPTNLMHQISYDAVGNVSSTRNPRGFITANAWSPTRKLLRTTLPATPQGTPRITNVYDRRDWLSQTIKPSQQSTLYTTDAAHRLISITDPLLRTTRFSYDQSGRQTCTTNAASEVTKQQWNKRGELIQTTDAASNIVKRAYDAAGNQITLTNRNAKKWQFQFDAANRLTNTITPLGRQTVQTWNDRGLLSSVQEPSGDTVSFTYDAKGRLTNLTDNLGAISYRYDANDNQTNVVEAGKTNAWTFDAYDHVASYRDADGNLIQYRYDGNGNVFNVIYPGGKTITNLYDSLNRLTNVIDWAGRKTSIEYDLASRVKKITRPNGTVREMNYDAAGQTTNITERTANVPITFLKLNWNAASRVDWEFVAPLPHAFTPPTRAMEYDEDNRISTFGGNSVTYDLDGNLTIGPFTNNTFGSYVYDARNRLLDAGGMTYAYDAAGNRTSLTNSGNVTKFVVNPNAALSQVLVRVKGGVTNYYVYGLGLLYEADDAGNTKTYHYDTRGSTIAITDSTGAVTDRIEYSAYGTTTYRTGNTDTPFLYNGRYGVQTDSNGLLYMRARYYNPYLCRFLNPDPAGFSAGLNFYAYADGNPISLLDPFGLGSMYDAASWVPNARGVAGFAIDQLYGGLRWLGGVGLDAIGTGLDFVGTPFGNPNLGDYFSNWAQQEMRGSSPAADAGWYDPNHPGTQAASVAMMFLTRRPSSQTTLFRVVGPDELSSIQQAGRYTPSPGGLEIKYFYPTPEQAASFAANPANRQFGPFTLTSTRVPTSVIQGNTVNVAREGTVVTLPNSTLPTVPSPAIHPSIPLSGAR